MWYNQTEPRPRASKSYPRICDLTYVRSLIWCKSYCLLTYHFHLDQIVIYPSRQHLGNMFTGQLTIPTITGKKGAFSGWVKLWNRAINRNSSFLQSECNKHSKAYKTWDVILIDLITFWYCLIPTIYLICGDVHIKQIFLDIKIWLNIILLTYIS